MQAEKVQNQELKAHIRQTLKSTLQPVIEDPQGFLSRVLGDLSGKRNLSGRITLDNKNYWLKLLPANRSVTINRKLEQAWACSLALATFDIATPRCYLAAHLQQQFQGISGVIIYEYCSGGQTLRDYLSGSDSESRDRTYQQLGQFLRQFHDHGFRHRDLRFTNILYREKNNSDQASGKFMLVDVNRVKRYRNVRCLDRIRDIERLLMPEEKLFMFYRAYTGESSIAGEMTELAKKRLEFWLRLKKHSTYTGKLLTRLWYYYWEVRCYQRPIALAEKP